MTKGTDDLLKGITEAIRVLRKHKFSNRGILSNLQKEYINFDSEEVNKAFSYLDEHCNGWDDEPFDLLVHCLYGTGGQQ
ncbi:hypothetical protein ACP8H5_21225 [Bacillus subtilis]|uniref:hypothetical protein n=1 Tax=Bacillus subtilis TaxID=1423 RepID=UPI003CEA3A01